MVGCGQESGSDQVRIFSKKAMGALNDLKNESTHDIRCLKSEGSISVGLSPLLRIKVVDEDVFSLSWNEAELEKRTWNNKEVGDAVQEAIAVASPTVRWG